MEPFSLRTAYSVHTFTLLNKLNSTQTFYEILDSHWG